MTDDARPRTGVPPGWPARVLPPGTPGWQEEAQRWLWELLPAQYGRHPLLHRQPVLLARQALLQVEAELVALRKGSRSARVDLAGLAMDPAVVEEALRLYAAEGERLQELAGQARLVTDALVHDVRRAGAGGG
ncbi:hypothetical protein ACIQGZ_16415 [Streptomyces sp. NPDC092296]|uniref:hypothetical protein n=1 Tax=Streptomyces sp. NPDC092296 TaxID=3366012 RepID=UPI003807967E